MLVSPGSGTTSGISGAGMQNTRQNIADILCIGCQKGSTSWLHSMLSRHPDTWSFPNSEPLTSTDKEAHFWDKNHELGVEWYRELMTPPDPALKTLDFTPEYAAIPHHHIAECKELNPGARVIYILRDPLARALSVFRMRMLWRFGAGADVRLDRALMEKMLPHTQIDAHGSYMRNLDAWRRHYPDILVLNYEEMHADRDAALARILEHTGLDPARLTGEHLERFEAMKARKVWESQPFEVDPEVLDFLKGYTDRTRSAVQSALGWEFSEGPQLIEAARGQTKATDDPMLDALQAIRQELQETRKAAEAQQKAQQKALDDVLVELQAQRRLARLLLDSSLQDMNDEIEAVIRPLQLTMTETLDAIHDERLSLARFGDGELMLMANGDYNIGFQTNSRELQQELKAATNPGWKAPGRVLVGMPPPFRGQLHWTGAYITMWSTLKPLIDPSQRYGHSMVTRPVFLRQAGAKGVEQWRRIWQGRPVLVVTGRGSRFDVIPELFDTAAKVDILHTAPRHSFEQREKILGDVLNRASPDTLVLLSLGPTATILAHHIAAAGIQALDIGHLSASYSHVFANGRTPESMQLVRREASS